MAGTLGKLLVTLGLDSSEFSSGLNQAASESEGLASNITGTLGNIALGASVAGIAALGGAFVTAVGNASEAQDVMAQTEAVIKSTGGAAGMSAQQMGDLASSLSSANGLSKYGDEAILTGENLLATFTNIGADVFPMATATMVDMATAMKTDVAGGAIQLGKALNDPTKGITALTRVGVTFTEEQQKMIAKLQATGDIVGAQKIILAELSKEFGGSAAAAAATFSGKIATLKDKFGELLEGVGTKLLPMLGTFVDTLNSPAVQSGIQAFADALVNGIGVAVNWLSTVAIPGIVTGWGVLTTAFSATLPYIQPVIDTFTNLSYYLSEVWASGNVLNIFLSTIPSLLQPIVVIIGDYVNVLGDYFDTIVNVGAALLNGDFMGALTALTTGLQGAAGDLLTYYTDIGTALATIGLYVAQQTLVWGQALVDWITPYIPIALTMLTDFITSIGAWIVAQAPTLATMILLWGTAFVAWVTPYIPVALAMLGTFLTSVGTWIVAQVPVLAAFVMTWASAFGDWISPYIPIVLNYLSSLITSVGAWISGQVGTLITSFTTWAVATYEWIPGATVDFLAAWPDMLNGFLDWIGSAVGPILAGFGLWLVGIIEWVAKSAPGIVKALMDWGIAFVAWIGPQIPGIVAALAGIAVAITIWVGETTFVIAAKLIEWGLAFIDWVGINVLPKLPGILAGIGSAIETFITGAITTVTTLAAGIGQGIIDGIKNADWSALGTWISDQLTGMLNAGKSALGISSPSKVFAIEVGQQIPAGIAMGIDAGASNMTSALTTLLGTAVAGAKSVASSVGSALTSGTLTAAGTAAGKAAIAGLAAGMLSAVGTAKSAAKSATDSITGSFKSALDIHSPSGVFADQIGVPIILGVVEGMNATMPKVLEWVRGNLGKKLAGYLTNAAAMVRGNLDIFTSLHDLEKLDPYQPLVDSTTALTTAQDAAVATSGKLQDVTEQIQALVQANSVSTDAQERVKNNQELTKLYQQQTQLMQDQANAQANLAQLGIAHAQALQASGQQQQAINQIALDAQRQYNDLAATSQSMMGVDAKRALDFFNMRKSQIQELADLQKQRALATNEDDQRFLDAQIALTRAAQQADTAAAQATVNVNVPGGTNDTSTQQITNIINQALKAAGYNTDVRVRTT